MPEPAGVHSGSPVVVGSQCMFAPQPGPGFSGSQSVGPPPVLDDEVVLDALVVVEVVVEVVVLLELAPPWPLEALVVVEVLEPVDVLLPLLDEAPPEPVVTFVELDGPDPLPPLPSMMLVPSAQAVDSATRVARPSVKRRGEGAITESS